MSRTQNLFRAAVHANKAVSKMSRAVSAEHAGSDARLFRHVPAWIEYEHISGFRYRLVRRIADPDDFLGSMGAGVTFLSYPGASGWADRIGSVAVHYMGKNWFVFSKILPFPEQREDKEEHDDLLLLGSDKHVMLTPSCVYRAPHGLTDGSSRVLIVKSSGGPVPSRRKVEALSPYCRLRVWASWGHVASDFAGHVAHLEPRDFDALEQEARSTRPLAALRLMWRNFIGEIHVDERPDRYPRAPLDPAYYEALLSVATGMGEQEMRARKLMRARGCQPHHGDGPVPTEPEPADVRGAASLEHVQLSTDEPNEIYSA